MNDETYYGEQETVRPPPGSWKSDQELVGLVEDELLYPAPPNTDMIPTWCPPAF